MVNIDIIASRSYYSGKSNSSGLIGGEGGLRSRASSGSGRSSHSSSSSSGLIGGEGGLRSRASSGSMVSHSSGGASGSSSLHPTTVEPSAGESPEVRKGLVDEGKRELEKRIEQEIMRRVNAGERFEDVVKDVANKYGVTIEYKKVEIPHIEIRAEEEKVEDKRDVVEKKTDEALYWIAKERAEAEYEGDRAKGFLGRLKAGSKLFALGVASGIVKIGKGTYEIIKKATVEKKPIEAGKEAVVGTWEWIESIPRRVMEAVQGEPFTAGELTGELIGGYAIGKGASLASKPIPKPAFASLTTLAGERVRYGITLHVMEKPLVTITREGVALGGREPPLKTFERIASKGVTAYSKLETEFFKKTLEAYTKETTAEIFKLAHEMTKKVYETKKPVIEPKKFEILSKNIPEEAKPVVAEAIKSYKGKLEVYGSVAQKLQMGEWMTREPKDIEVVVDNVEKFTNELKKRLDKAGVEYRIEGLEKGKPKVYFRTKEGWVKGIEIFEKEEKYELGLSKRSAIRYGFERQKPLKVEGLKIMRLSEQTARKLEGGHVLKGREIKPVHEGRWKDINDLIEILTAYERELRLNIEKNLIRYVDLVSKEFGKKIETPVAKFILEKKRLPTKEELSRIAKEMPERERRELIYRKEKLSMKEVIENYSKEISSQIARLREVESSIYSAIRNVEKSSSILFEPSSRIREIGKSSRPTTSQGVSSFFNVQPPSITPPSIRPPDFSSITSSIMNQVSKITSYYTNPSVRPSIEIPSKPITLTPGAPSRPPVSKPPTSRSPPYTPSPPSVTLPKDVFRKIREVERQVLETKWITEMPVLDLFEVDKILKEVMK